MCGGAVPTIQMSVRWVSRPLPPNCGTGRHKAVSAFEFVKARLTGAKPNLGEKRKVSIYGDAAAALSHESYRHRALPTDFTCWRRMAWEIASWKYSRFAT